jgi:hypothetical protein
MPHDALLGNRGHHAVAVVDAFFAREQEREGDRFGDVAGVSFWSSKRDARTRSMPIAFRELLEAKSS